MEKLYEEAVFTPDSYDDLDAMWEDITTFIRILLNNSYTVVIRDDDVDIIVVEYNYDTSKTDYGTPELEWITLDEAEALECARCENYDECCHEDK